MDNQLSVEDKSELREVLKKLGNLPEDSQEIVKSGVLKLLENEEKKVEKLVSLKEYLEQEGFIEGNVIFVSKFYALKNKREQSSIIKLGKFYGENYSKNSKSEYSYYEYSLILIKEKFPDLKFDENILTKKEKKNKRKENQAEVLYQRLVDEEIINENEEFSYSNYKLLLDSINTRKVLQDFSKYYGEDKSYISAIKEIFKIKKISIDTNAFNHQHHKGIELDKKVANILEKLSAKRLILNNQRQEILPEDTQEIEDKNGVLCVNIDGVYKKINVEKYLPLLASERKGQTTIGVKDIIKKYGLQSIKLSDLGGMKTHSKSLLYQNALPMNNNIHIKVPSKVMYNETPYILKNETAKTLVINNTTIVIYDEGYSFIIDTSNTTREKQSLGTQGFHDRATEYTPMDYIKQKKGEKQNDYFKRLMRFSSFEFLPAVYNDLLDNAYFELQNYSLEEQMSFGVYYSSLDEKHKSIIKNLLKKYGDDIFNVFKICEDSIGNGNLIIDIYNKFGETKSIKIFEKIVGIIDILKNGEKVKKHGGNDTNLYLEVMNKALSSINKVLQEDSKNNIESILDKIQDELLEEGLIFKNIKEKGIQGLNDVDKARISMTKIKSKELDTESKAQIKERLMSLYKDNYSIEEEANFIDEIEKGIDTMLNDKKNTDIYTFEVKGKTILSCYVSNIDEENVYIGGLNANEDFKDYSFGFWVLEKILNEYKNKNRHAKVFTSIEGKEKRNGKILLRKYKSMGTNILEEGTSPESNFTNIVWEKRK